MTDIPAPAARPVRIGPGAVEIALGGGIILAWLTLALGAPLFAGLDPNAISFTALLQPPGTPGHLLGTDHIGRDVLARVLFAARIDIWMGVAGVVPPLLIGVLVGLISGYAGGRLDAVMMRLVDITVAFPFFVLVIAIVGILGPGLGNYFVALALVGWVSYARLMRAEVMVLRNKEFVTAAKVLGYGAPTILFRHILPNTLTAVLVYATTDAVLVLLAGASLGFLGLGVQPPTPEWGAMIAEGQPYVVQAWWICFFPGLAAMSLCLGFILLSDGFSRVLGAGRR
ncbi:MAG TPA: ABC transporter permease [Mesorhizobium sp.]|nr:ABC transporter permease [Mesorhizobium sp.]